mgnify:CR=1 FL=1|jgi:ATP-dependent protease ClpP protease subunit
MKAFISTVLTLLATLIIPASSIASTPQAALLKPGNTLTLFGVVNEDMVETVAKKIPELSSDTIYVQILSPGGSVVSGKRIIDQLVALQAQGKKVVCVAHIAISMAFVILQSPACPDRRVVSGAILMQHQASAGLEGPILNLLSQVKALVAEIEEIEQMQADRLKLSLNAFRALTVHDYWLNSGSSALKAKAADAPISLLCSKDLIKQGKREELVLGRVKLVATYSDCPYVVKPQVEIKPMEDRKKNIIDIRL